MAESDDEYDRKRRDKFRGERDSYRPERRDDRRPMGGGAGNARDEWAERNPFRGSAAAGGGGGGGGVGGGGGARHRPDYSDYRGSGPRPRYGSPGREMPPAKRMRPDWGDGEMRANPRFGKAYGSYDPYLVQAWNDHYQSLHSAYSHSGHAPSAREPPPSGISNSDTQTQPAMLTLKQFLDTQDENISDSEVMRKYTEYKTDFKRQQLNEFFVAHKDEEWFKNKYHPEDSVRRSDEQRGFLKRRTDVFLELLNNGTISNVKVDSSQADALVRVLDTCVIKLEGGTDEDLKILDEKPKDPAPVYERRSERSERSEATESVVVTKREPESPKHQTKSEKDDDDLPEVESPQRKNVRPVNSDDEDWDDDEEMPAAKSEQQSELAAEKPAKQLNDEESMQANIDKNQKKSKKRKRTSSDDESSSSSSSESDSDSDDEKLIEKYDVEEGLRADQKAEAEKDKEEEEERAATAAAKAKQLPPDSPTPDEDVDAAAVEEQKNEVVAIKTEVNDEESQKTEQPAAEEEKSEQPKDDPEASSKNGEENEEEKAEKSEADTATTKAAAAAADDDAMTETIDVDKLKDSLKPRALHRTSSIFLRNLAPSITKAEIETICTRFSGYLRVAIADPLVERRWYRRGWITFTRDVNIKEICWSLNNQRLRDCEMGAIVNRDLSRRVRPANGITAHKQIVRSDIKLCAKIAMNLDERFKLWSEVDNADNAELNPEELKEATNGSGSYGFNSKNPVLQNITDYLIEEASAEEEELLGLAGDSKDGEGEPIERDEPLIQVLDRLVLYLRVVHSVDYYNHCEYPYEDEMPNRCGIIHARGPAPMRVTSNDVQEYIKSYEGKLQQFLAKTVQLSDENIKELGAKNPEKEVEKFVQANTQELAKDKWLCPLSGKKFKGPEFIRKHIFNKHEEKVDEVRKEVQYFNNYLRDPKRPQLPEHPGSSKRTESESGRGSGGYRPPMYPPFSAMPYGFAPPMMGGGGRGGRNFPQARRPGGFDYRARSHYRDLDAPQEPY
ncbi:serrate RNA effector molecule homolog isoform X2 [Drosophila grimshawi]|uniref:serrate RNA effector molecule homolog isoform X2 n=1 Tax=Drosophila grimshawi TaxID=7222 RepID=UPI000C871139|nr:serrate RNA effector molecule homolog isoform X2 [Drosophila grimshawi]